METGKGPLLGERGDKRTSFGQGSRNSLSGMEHFSGDLKDGKDPCLTGETAPQAGEMARAKGGRKEARVAGGQGGQQGWFEKRLRRGQGPATWGLADRGGIGEQCSGCWTHILHPEPHPGTKVPQAGALHSMTLLPPGG